MITQHETIPFCFTSNRSSVDACFFLNTPLFRLVASNCCLSCVLRLSRGNPTSSRRRLSRRRGSAACAGRTWITWAPSAEVGVFHLQRHTAPHLSKMMYEMFDASKLGSVNTPVLAIGLHHTSADVRINTCTDISISFSIFSLCRFFPVCKTATHRKCEAKVRPTRQKVTCPLYLLSVTKVKTESQLLASII